MLRLKKIRCPWKAQQTNTGFYDAGAAGLEPAAYGFGDRHSTN